MTDPGRGPAERPADAGPVAAPHDAPPADGRAAVDGVRGATRLAVGAALWGLDGVTHLLEVVAARAEGLPALPPGPDAAPGTPAPGTPAPSATATATGAAIAAGPAPAGEAAPAGPDGGPASAAAGRGRDPRAVLLGAAFELEDRTLALAGAGARIASRVGPSVAWVWSFPGLGAVRRRVDAELDRLAERGLAEEARARRDAGLALGVVVDGTVGTVVASPRTTEVAEQVIDQLLPPLLDVLLPPIFDQLGDEPELLVPLVERIVGEVLDPILGTAIPQVLGQLQDDPTAIVALVNALVGQIIDPVLEQALPKAIDYLNQDPEVVRSLVRDQGMGFADEVAGTVRVRARSADKVVDDVVRRVLRRRTAEALAAGPTPDALGPGEPPS